MNGSKRKTLTVIGCVCFGAVAAVNAFQLIQYRAIGGMLGALIYLLLVLALAFRSPLLLAAAGICLVIQCVFGACTNCVYYKWNHNMVSVVTGLLDVAASAFLLLLGLNRRRSVRFAYLAAAIDLLSVLLTYFGWHIPGLGGLQQPIRPIRLALPVLWIAGVILTGCLRREMPTVGAAWKRLLNKDTERRI